MKKNKLPTSCHKGQILLISLMVLSVAMTVILSIATRTISTLRMTSAQDSSQRAFSAAEAGLEKALIAASNTTYTENLSNNSSFTASSSRVTADEFLVSNGGLILKNNAADVWLSNYPDYSSPWSGMLTIYWGSLSDVCVAKPEVSNTMAAMEIILISGTRLVPVIEHYAFDPCVPRSNSNKFSTVLPGGTVGGKDFAYSANISVFSGLIARVIPLYANTFMGIKGTGLPPQGTKIISVGSSGNTKRQIVTFVGYPEAPVEFYPFLIFSSK